MDFVPLADSALGAEVLGLKTPLDELPEDQFSEIREALNKYSLLIFRSQGALSPQGAASFVHRFDPHATTVWRDQATNPWELYKAQHLGTAGTFQLPDCPACLCLGNGQVSNHFGLTATLGGKRLAYGKTEGSQVIGGGKLQWHIDGAFWESQAASGLPCFVTGMRCFETPDDGIPHDIPLGDESSLTAARGSTAFVSAYEAFNRLTPPEQASALHMTARYAIHPFKRFSKLGMTADGLKCTGGPPDETQIGEEDRQLGNKSLRLPLVWSHPDTGRQALMPHTRCIEALEKAQSTAGNGRIKVELDIHASREYLYALMRRAVDTESVYAHAWQVGDFVIWDNRGIWHSATGGMRPDDRRVMHLIAYDGSAPPTCTPSLVLQPAAVSTARELSVLALIIGQTPRPDLVEPMEKLLMAHIPRQAKLSITCCGALDGVDAETMRTALASDSSCPLVTRLADGQKVVASEGVLAPLLQRQLHKACLSRAAKGQSPYAAAILLCAGEFLELCSLNATPLVKPSLVAKGALRAFIQAPRQLKLFVPNMEQGSFAVQRWSQAFRCDLSFHVLPEDLTPSEVSAAVLAACRSRDDEEVQQGRIACVLDFFGHSAASVEAARQAAFTCNAIFLDVGSLAAEVLCAILLGRVVA